MTPHPASFRRSPDHGRAADIDVLNGVLQSDIRLQDGLLERVQVDGHHIDEGNPSSSTWRMWSGLPAWPKCPHVPWDEGFSPGRQALWEAGDLADASDRHPFSWRVRAVPGGDHLIPSSSRALANSTMPVLSETLKIALLFLHVDLLRFALLPGIVSKTPF